MRDLMFTHYKDESYIFPFLLSSENIVSMICNVRLHTIQKRKTTKTINEIQMHLLITKRRYTLHLCID